MSNITCEELDTLLFKHAEDYVDNLDEKKENPPLRGAIDKTVNAAKTVGGAVLAVPAALAKVNTHMPLQEVQ